MRSFVFAALLSSLAAHADALLVDRIVAVVDGRPISRSMVELRAQARVKAAATKEAKEKALKEVLGALIDERLILKDAKRLQVSIADEDVDRAIALIGKQAQLSPEALEVEIKRQGFSVPEYRATLGWQLIEMKWLNAKRNRSPALGADPAGDKEARARFLAELRAEFAVEVRQ